MAIDKTKIISIGNSLGIILSKEVLNRLDLDKGDEIMLSKTTSGFEISPYKDDIAEDIEIAKGVMKRHREVLKKLAE
jgi:putative addiction module antidote